MRWLTHPALQCRFPFDHLAAYQVTEECLLHPTRNPGLSKEEIESRLKEYLNVDKARKKEAELAAAVCV
jgi:hypothetical protein